MKTRYFVSDDYDRNFVGVEIKGKELYLKNGEYFFKDGLVDGCDRFCSEKSHGEVYITKVEEMELSDFIADGRTKYELNGIRFVVDSVYKNKCEIKIKTDEPCCIVELSGNEPLFVKNTKPSCREWILTSMENDTSKHYHSHIEDIKIVTTCGQCGKDEIQDAVLCSDCISKLPKIESRKVVDIHKSENGSFSVGSVVKIEKEVPELSDMRNKYDVQIVGKDGVKTTVDVYRVLNAFDVHDAATQHAIKKLLAAGKRGHKDYVQDLKEANASIELAIIEWEQTNV